MTELVEIFERLGLQQYLDAFIDEGFDTWEVVLFITESDLDKLNVKLGHRRKLQSAIANARGLSFEQVIASHARAPSLELPQYAESEGRPSHRDDDDKGKRDISQHSTGAAGTKRKYRRHPKADENAPERPPSAYVLFSNKIREEIKHQKMSFTEIAKTVGEKWQMLLPEEKEPFEKEAMALKETYSTEMARYKQTENYQEYARYLADFKAKNAPPQLGSEGKRPKTEASMGSNASSTSGGSVPPPSFGHERSLKDSPVMIGNSPSLTSLNSPITSASRSFIGRPIESSPPPVLTGLSHSPSPFSAQHQLRRSPSTPQDPPLAQTASEQSRNQPLPRISSMDARDSSIKRISLAPLLTEPEQQQQQQHPRRSNNSPATFVRNDTSKSSVSSTFSAIASNSSGQSPITPAEPARVLPPVTNPSYVNPVGSIGGQYMESGRSYPFGPAGAGFGGGPSEHASEYPQIMNRLSIGEQASSPAVQLNLHIGRGPDQQPLGPGQRVPPIQDILQQNPQREQERPSLTSGSLDPLSVLALAGRLVERETHGKQGP